MTSDRRKALTQAIDHLAAVDQCLAPIIAKHGPCTITPHSDHYGALVDAIIGQQLSEKAGATILRRFLDLFDDSMPAPEAIVAMDTERIRAVGVSYGKIRYMKDLAEHILDGRLDLVRIAQEPNDVVIKELVAVKGIGEWTAHMFMIFSLGRLDILPVGDLGVRKSMMQLYNLSELPDAETMQAVASSNHWSPYQSIASWYLWKRLDTT